MRLLIVSNRLPFTAVEEEGEITFQESVGGLVSGLSSYLGSLKGTPFTQASYIWIGWPGVSVPQDRQQTLRAQVLERFRAWPVFLDEATMEEFYHGFCNKTLWPLFHYFPSYTAYEQTAWQTYHEVNQAFCEVVLQTAQPDDIVWIQDYHLMLLPQLLRERRPDLAIGFFLHIPFPTYEIFRLLPSAWRAELLRGLLGADLVGFHTNDDASYFLDCVTRILDLEPDESSIPLGERIVQVGGFPISIDVDRFATASEQPEVMQVIQELAERLADRKVILSVDRLDYTKGILHRLQGYQIFLERNPGWHGRVTLILVVVPSRIGVEHYQRMRQQIDETVGRLNGSYGSLHWTPIIYQYRYLPLDTLSALYAVADAALITPLRDGMNLVAKEYVASRANKPGVLILSEMAGAAKELTEAVVINPNNREEIAEAILTALEMPEDEQIQRNAAMQARLRRYDVVKWANEFIHSLRAVKDQQRQRAATRCDSGVLHQIQGAATGAQRRLLLLDYDGTLIPFAATPQAAQPTDDLLRVLEQLAAESRNHVVVISGRDRRTLGAWLTDLDITLVAEHGIWIRARGQEWSTSGVPASAWKADLRPLLERYVDHVPGSAIEEKEFCLVWHYRKVEADVGARKAKELAHELMRATASLELEVLQGNKVVEVRNPAFHKGTAVRRLLEAEPADFILALGDDWTDEDMFKVLPATAFSIKVGSGPTAARWHLVAQDEVLPLLAALCQRR